VLNRWVLSWGWKTDRVVDDEADDKAEVDDVTGTVRQTGMRSTERICQKQYMHYDAEKVKEYHTA